MKIRQAILNDSDDIWHWRNDQTTRNMSFQTKEISKDENLDWLTSSLSSKDRLLLVGFDEFSKIGICRFDISSQFSNAEVSINLNPSSRGKGLSKELLTLSIKYFLSRYDKSIIARIKKQNIPSIRLFERCNFVLSSQNEIDLLYEYSE
jgi:RimJ/RimL family protein N-acetyltransferase